MGKQRREEKYLAVRSQLMLRSADQKAVAVEVRNWYGLLDSVPGESEQPKGSRYHETRYAVHREEALILKKLVTPEGMIEPGASMTMLHVANRGHESQWLYAGERLAWIGEPSKVTSDQTKQEACLASRIKKALQERKDLADFEHASDLAGTSWVGKKVLLNVLDYGSAEKQSRVKTMAEQQGAQELVLLQCVADDSVLEPWRSAGYEVTDLGMRECGAVKGKLERKRESLSYEEEGKRLWLIEKRFNEEDLKLTVGYVAIVDENEKENRMKELEAQLRKLIGDEENALTEEQVELVVSKLMPFQDVFDPQHLGRVDFMEAEIDTGMRNRLRLRRTGCHRRSATSSDRRWAACSSLDAYGQARAHGHRCRSLSTGLMARSASVSTIGL